MTSPQDRPILHINFLLTEIGLADARYWLFMTRLPANKQDKDKSAMHREANSSLIRHLCECFIRLPGVRYLFVHLKIAVGHNGCCENRRKSRLRGASHRLPQL